MFQFEAPTPDQPISHLRMYVFNAQTFQLEREDIWPIATLLSTEDALWNQQFTWREMHAVSVRFDPDGSIRVWGHWQYNRETKTDQDVTDQGLGPLLWVQLDAHASPVSAQVTHPTMQPQAFKKEGFICMYEYMPLGGLTAMLMYTTQEMFARLSYPAKSKTKTDTLTYMQYHDGLWSAVCSKNIQASRQAPPFIVNTASGGLQSKYVYYIFNNAFVRMDKVLSN
jgi:hypothetical protein